MVFKIIKIIYCIGSEVFTPSGADTKTFHELNQSLGSYGFPALSFNSTWARLKLLPASKTCSKQNIGAQHSLKFSLTPLPFTYPIFQFMVQGWPE